jgi:hypothetical protein
MGDEGGFSSYYIHYRNNEEFRRLLLSIASVLLKGSTTESITTGLQLFTHNKIELQELYIQPWAEIWQRFMWRILVIIGDDFEATINLDSARANLERLTRIIKPAHTLLDIGFIWGESFYFTVGCTDVVDLETGEPITQPTYKRFEFDYGENLKFDKLMEDPYCLLDGYAFTGYAGDNAPWHLRTPNARFAACEDYIFKMDTKNEEQINLSDINDECFINIGKNYSETFDKSNISEEPTGIQTYIQLGINFDYDTSVMDNKFIRLDYPLVITMTGNKLENRVEN